MRWTPVKVGLTACNTFVAIVQVSVVADSIWHAKPLTLGNGAPLAVWAVLGIVAIHRWETAR